MSKIRIDKEDAERILITELLPYEVPMLFSNDGFYKIVSSKKFEYFLKRIKGIKENGEYGIPFNFEVRKSASGETRLLSVIHPFNQVEFIDFYQKYDSLIIHQCSKSPFSLRKISKVASFYYSPNFVFEEDEHKNDDVEVEPDVLIVQTKYFKSYFTYKPIDLIYKFYDRNEYQRLEQRFNLLMEFDINKCFYNIYTHSVTWAVKDKESAKRNSRKESFENKFDKLMQKANYNETNGILVGPEISRIFAEIILQQIDVNVLLELETQGIKFGVDYEVRRYVDDYFIFTNDENHQELIFKAFKKELNEYKLYVNDSKTIRKQTPFITDHAVGKRELAKLFNDFAEKFIESSKTEVNGEVKEILSIKEIRNEYFFSQQFINDFQCIVKRNNLRYDSLSKDVVRFCKSFFVWLLKKKIEDKPTNYEKLILTLLDVTFYAYSLNITSSTTFKLAQLIVLVSKFLNNQPENFKHNVFTKIHREVEFVMTCFQRKAKAFETNVESLNLLIATKKLDKIYALSEKKIQELLNLDEKNEDSYDRLNYFHIITLLYYIEEDPAYSVIRENILKCVKRKFENQNDPFTKSELTMLFFDIINCPYIVTDYKKDIIKITKYANIQNATQEIQKICEQGQWFMDWDRDIDLERVLKKKEWGSSY